MLKERLARVKENAVRKYQVVVYDKESLTESRNFSTKPLTVFFITVGLSLILILGTTALIFYVPAINQLIPGFKDPALQQQEYQELRLEYLKLEKDFEAMDTMLAGMNRVTTEKNPTASDREMWAAITPEAEPGQSDLVTQEDAAGTSRDEEEPAALVLPSGEDANDRLGLPADSRPKMRYFNLMPPLEGIISNPFSMKDKPHYGMDIVADENSMIRSVADGVVVFSEYSNTTGHVLGIWHQKENLISFYKHNSKVFKQVGDFAFAGESIAVIGNTGINSSGTHLHFELWYDNGPVDPARLIDFK